MPENSNPTALLTYYDTENGNEITKPQIVIGYDNCTNVIEIKNDFGVTISPNPANDNICIETTQGGKMKIINSQGQIMSTIILSNQKTIVDVTNLIEGVYVLKITNDRQSVTKKFIKL